MAEVAVQPAPSAAPDPAAPSKPEGSPQALFDGIDQLRGGEFGLDGEGAKQLLSFEDATTASPDADLTGYDPNKRDGTPPGTALDPNTVAAAAVASPPSNQDEEVTFIPPMDKDGKPLYKPEGAPAPAVTSPATGDGKPPVDPSATGPTIEELQATINEMRDVATFMSSITQEEFEASRIIAQEFRKDPVAFIKQYTPEIIPQLIGDQMLTNPETDPIAYADSYAERKLSTKYGDDFEFNPADALIKGTQSYEYARDRQLFLNEGQHTFFQKQEEQRQSEAQRTEASKNQAKDIAGRFHVPAEKVDEVLAIADAIPMTPANYYAMLFTYLKAIGKLDPFIVHAGSAATGKPTNGITRQTPPVPPTVTGVPGASSRLKVLEETFPVFPASYIAEQTRRG